jgi:hypothetical protein
MGLTKADMERKVLSAPDALLRLWLLDSRRWVRPIIKREQRRRRSDG